MRKTLNFQQGKDFFCRIIRANGGAIKNKIIISPNYDYLCNVGNFHIEGGMGYESLLLKLRC